MIGKYTKFSNTENPRGRLLPSPPPNMRMHFNAKWNYHLLSIILQLNAKKIENSQVTTPKTFTHPNRYWIKYQDLQIDKFLNFT